MFTIKILIFLYNNILKKNYLDCLTNYLYINQTNFNSFFLLDDYLNENSLYYYIVQRSLRAGLKLRFLHHFFKTLRLLHFYNYFFFNKQKRYYRFYDGLSFDNSYIMQYSKVFPTFSLRLDNEYKGKHKTKRKYIYSTFLKRKKSQLFELALWFNRISYKYKYRNYSTRLSVILFNFFYYFDTAFDKIGELNDKIYALQRKGGRIFISFNDNKLEFKAEKEIKVQL